MAGVWAILAVSLLPFFALREIGRNLGEGELWKLMLRPSPDGPTMDETAGEN